MSENTQTPRHEIKVPSLGESITEATVARWVKDLGQSVKADDLLLELETDKITLEVTAPVSGTLTEIHHKEGSNVTVGQILGLITPGEPAQKSKLTSASSPAPSNEPASTPELAVASKPATPTPTSPVASASAADKESVLPFSGIKTAIPRDITIPNLSPSARKLVAERNINPATLSGTGKDQVVTKQDVLTHVAPPVMSQTSSQVAFTMPDMQETGPSESSASETSQTFVSNAREERVRMSRLRQRIAQRLKEAQNTAAILTTFNEVDMSAINELRGRYKDHFEKKHGIKLGFMSFFVKAALRALKEFPEVNAEIDGDTVIYKNYYDIGVAVSAPQGLVVPVLRDADILSFAEIEKRIIDLGTRAREGKLNIDEMTGGTFTISNGGIFGSLMSTPIINPPQTGIMGMHKIQDRPVAVQGKVEIRPMMYIALSYDHRLIDGREAVGFLVRIKENIENPERLLLEV